MKNIPSLKCYKYVSISTIQEIILAGIYNDLLNLLLVSYITHCIFFILMQNYTNVLCKIPLSM